MLKNTGNSVDKYIEITALTRGERNCSLVEYNVIGQRKLMHEDVASFKITKIPLQLADGQMSTLNHVQFITMFFT